MHSEYINAMRDSMLMLLLCINNNLSSDCSIMTWASRPIASIHP